MAESKGLILRRFGRDRLAAPYNLQGSKRREMASARYWLSQQTNLMQWEKSEVSHFKNVNGWQIVHQI